MSSPILFQEVQQFRQKWVEGLMLVVNTMLIVAFSVETFLVDHPGTEARAGLFTAIVICWAVTFLLKKIKLITQITPEGIQVRFAPLQRGFQLYRWADIEQLSIRRYNPLLEYGGWGLRMGPSGSAYNVSGNMGLQLVLRGNYKILIGTEQPDQLLEVLHRLGRL